MEHLQKAIDTVCKSSKNNSKTACKILECMLKEGEECALDFTIQTFKYDLMEIVPRIVEVWPRDYNTILENNIKRFIDTTGDKELTYKVTHFINFLNMYILLNKKGYSGDDLKKVADIDLLELLYTYNKDLKNSNLPDYIKTAARLNGYGEGDNTPTLIDYIINLYNKKSESNVRDIVEMLLYITNTHNTDIDILELILRKHIPNSKEVDTILEVYKKIRAAAESAAARSKTSRGRKIITNMFGETCYEDALKSEVDLGIGCPRPITFCNCSLKYLKESIANGTNICVTTQPEPANDQDPEICKPEHNISGGTRRRKRGGSRRGGSRRGGSRRGGLSRRAF